MSSSEQEREYEEGAAGTEIGRKDDSLTEYREREAITPAKEKALPTHCCKTRNDRKDRNKKSDPEKSSEVARRSGMAKGTV